MAQYIKTAISLEARKPKPEIITCCPKCHNETLTVKIESSGWVPSEFGTCYWYSGEGVCSNCGWAGQHDDHSI